MELMRRSQMAGVFWNITGSVALGLGALWLGRAAMRLAVT